MLGVGGVCGAWISYGTYIGFTDDRQWRIPFGLQIVPAALLASLIILFPESPRWLIKKGKTEEGLKTLARLHSAGDVDDAWVLAEHQQIQESVALEAELEAKSYIELFHARANFRRVVIACAIQAATQMTGISAIQYYSVTIFVGQVLLSPLNARRLYTTWYSGCLTSYQAQVGITGEETLRYQAINSVIGLISEILIMFFVDKVGRRTIIIVGSLLMALTYIVSTVLMAEFPASDSNVGAHWGFIIMTWLFNFCFSSMGSLCKSPFPMLLVEKVRSR
jgi:MFS family permease